MNIKIEQAFIILLLLPFGLRGVMPIPAVNFLFILMPIVLLSLSLTYFNRGNKSFRIGKLAVTNQMLSLDDVSMILFCQKFSREKFGEIAVRRNFISTRDLESLLVLQASKQAE